MTPQEQKVMELALEALGAYMSATDSEEDAKAHNLMAEAFFKIKEALAEPEQEPVAWIHNFIDGGISIGKRPADLNRHPDRWTALYKEPKPCPTCEALARTVMLDQTSHDTTPPQRKPLTDEHPLMVFAKECVLGAYQETELADAAKRAIEAAHNIKEKT